MSTIRYVRLACWHDHRVLVARADGTIGYEAESTEDPAVVWELVQLNDAGGVALRSAVSHRYLSAQPETDGFKVVCDREWCRNWEHWTLQASRYGGTVGFRSFHGRWLCAQSPGSAPEVLADRPALAQWESFELKPSKALLGQVVVASCHEKLLSVGTGTRSAQLCCDQDSKIAAEGAARPDRWFLYRVRPGVVAFQSRATMLFLSAQTDHTVVCDRSWCRPWEEWRVEAGTTRGTLAFRSEHGRYLCAEPSGAVIANREHLGPWECFTLLGADGHKFDADIFGGATTADCGAEAAAAPAPAVASTPVHLPTSNITVTVPGGNGKITVNVALNLSLNLALDNAGTGVQGVTATVQVVGCHVVPSEGGAPSELPPAEFSKDKF